MRTAIPITILLAACKPDLQSPTPTLASIEPALVCNAQLTTTIQINGASLTPVPLNDLNEPALAIPDLSLAHALNLDGAAGTSAMTDLDEAAGSADNVTWQSTAGMAFDVTPDRLPPGVYDLNLLQADGQSASLAAALAVVPPPTLTSAEPSLLCDAQGDVEVTLVGSGFLDVGGTLPTVHFGDHDLPADSMSDCTPLAGPVAGQLCTTITVTVPTDAIPAGVFDVSVTNPAPADCSSTDAVQIEVVPEPEITALLPDSVCEDAGTLTLEVQGTGFVVVGGTTYPTVTVGTSTRTVTGADGCTNLVLSGEVCTSLDVELPVSDYALGTYDVTVANPDPPGCSTETPFPLDVVPPPTITDVAPDAICDSGGSFTITGTGFTSGTTVEVDGVPAASVTVVSDTELQVTAASGMTTGFQDVAVFTAGGCTAVDAAAIEVVPAPLLFYVDPPVAYSGVNLEVTLFVAGVTGDITDVWLERVADGVTTDLVFDATNPDQIKATVPAGLPEGDYDVHLLQDDTCPALLDQGLFVEADATVSVESVDPSFAWTSEYSPIQVLSADPTPNGMVPFTDLPRVYLDPVSSATATATAVLGLSYVDPFHLDAVVPPGLTPDDYDVIVVNPDGSVGILPAGLTVTDAASPPPRVDSLSPPSIPNSGTQTVTIAGANFRGSVVTFECLDPTTGAPTTATVTPSTETSTTLTTPVPASTLFGICIATVTNADGTYVTYSSMSVTNASQNLDSYTVSAAPMGVARRAPAAVAGRATRTARYLYAIGGDSGTTAGALASVEASGVDKFGDLVGFFPLANALPEPITLAGVARIGRFVYVVGGHDGETAVDPGPQSSVYRAEILDPLASPRIDDLSVDYGDGTNLDVGTWSWRVAAKFDVNDASNPGGVSLASDPIVAHLPDIPDTFEVTIAWNAVPGAVGYRIYRSPDADAPSNTEVFLADVTGNATTTFTDLGAAPTSSERPLAKGEVGRWKVMPPLPGARQAACVTTGADPSNPAMHYLYAAGGTDGVAVKGEVYYLDVLDAGASQTAGTWKTATNALATPAQECGAWTVDSAFHTVVADDETWTYFGGGRTGLTGTATTGKMYAGRITAGGNLGTWTVSSGPGVIKDMVPERAGFGVFSASDFLYMAGGQSAAPSASAKSTHIDGPPDLGNYNAGYSLSTPRYLPGSAQESGVTFIVGGTTDAAAASNTVEWANF